MNVADLSGAFRRDPLQQPATPERLRLLQQVGLLKPDEVRLGLQHASATPSVAQWSRFLSVLLLLVGAALALSGIVYFFAYNWDALDRFAQLGLCMLGTTLAFGGAVWRGTDTLPGRVCLTAASVGVGVLLAVYGQIYQTGADNWELFATWALLILPWVLVGRATGLWMLQIVLLNLTVCFGLTEVIPSDRYQDAWVFLSVGVLNAVAFGGWITAAGRWVWLKVLWAPRLLLSAALISILVPVIAFLMTDDNPTIGLLGGGVLIGLAAVTTLRARSGGDLFAPTATAGAILCAFNAFLGRVLLVELELAEFGAFLLAIALLVQAAVILRVLIRLQRTAEGS